MTVQSHTTTANIERENVVRSTSAFAVHSGMEFADEDRTFPYRIVGSYEYGTSLSNLGALVDSSTSEQIEVYDKLIGLNSEYSFYSGVVTDLGFDTDFSSSDGESSSDVESGYLKHSLAWMMALARVELGATMSMYGDGEDPFGNPVRLGGVRFGAEEYLSILVDDVAAHLKAAQTDSGYISALNRKSKVDGSTLKHLRRTQLIDDMLAKVVSSQIPEIVAVVGPYSEAAQQYVDDITEKISIATTTFVSPPTISESTESSSFSGTFDSEELTSVQFQNRGHLLACQLALESLYPPPATAVSPLSRRSSR